MLTLTRGLKILPQENVLETIGMFNEVRLKLWGEQDSIKTTKQIWKRRKFLKIKNKLNLKSQRGDV